MRIRKNAKLSSLINLTRAKSVHVCELNQSPWDVIPSTQEPYPSYLHHRFEPEDIFNGNGSLGDSIGAVESVASMMDNEDKSIMKVERMIIDDEEETKIGDQFGFHTHCEDEGKGSKQNCSLKSCCHDNGNNPSSLTSKKAGNRRGRAGAANKGQSSTSNPYELYYYFGSGPSWRRRGGNNSEMRENIIVEGKDFENNSSAVTTQNNNTMPSSSSSQFDNNEEFDYVGDEEDDEENVMVAARNERENLLKENVKVPNVKNLIILSIFCFFFLLLGF